MKKVFQLTGAKGESLGGHTFIGPDEMQLTRMVEEQKALRPEATFTEIEDESEVIPAVIEVLG